MTRSAIEQIEIRRVKLGASRSEVCRTAGVGRTTYLAAVAGREAMPSTVIRLSQALDRIRAGHGREAGELAPFAAFKMCVLSAAGFLQADARVALHSDPARRATADPVWREAARVRRLAIFLHNQFLGFRQTDTARAAGVTKQAVSLIIREIEDERDAQRGLDQWLNEMERTLS